MTKDSLQSISNIPKNSSYSPLYSETSANLNPGKPLLCFLFLYFDFSPDVSGLIFDKKNTIFYFPKIFILFHWNVDTI